MRLLKPSATLINVSHSVPVKFIDHCGRVCYKSESNGDPQKWSKFVRARIKDGHESVLEHVNATVLFICDRGVSHELVRHRIASFSQESTRYCNYGSDHISFIIPCWTELSEGQSTLDINEESTMYQGILFYNDNELKWLAAMAFAENFYRELLRDGWSPQQARSVLPNSLKTELVMTTNLREWRHIFSLRCDRPAHPQMRELMLPLLDDFHSCMPDFFFDLHEKFFGGSSEREETR